MNIWSIFILLVVVYPAIITCSDVDIVDFDKYIYEKAVEIANRSSAKVAWVDAYHNNSNLMGKKAFNYCRITVTVANMEYHSENDPIQRPDTVYSQIYVNDADIKITETLERKVTTEHAVQWNIGTKFAIGYEAKVKTGFPGIVNFGAKLNVDVDLTNDKVQQNTTTETETKTSKIIIPPRKKVIANLFLADKEMNIPWTADVVISGYIAVSYENELHGRYLYCYPIKDFSGSKFPYQETSSGLVYKANGIFKALKGTDTKFQIYEYDIATDIPNPANPPETKRGRSYLA